LISLDGDWGAWSPYSACSKTCGVGLTGRTRNCDSPIPQFGGLPCALPQNQTIKCYTSPCPIGCTFLTKIPKTFRINV